jgi:twitching motility protein PilI
VGVTGSAETWQDSQEPIDRSVVASGNAGTPPPEPTAPTEETGAEPAPIAIERMGFRVGEFGLLLPAQSAREVVIAPAASRMPNTAPWLLGLANVRGNLVPVVDTAMALGTSSESNLPAYALIFGQGDSAIALLIDGLPRLLALNESERVVGDVATPDVLSGSVVAAYEHGGRVWLDIDRLHLLDRLSRSIAL